MKKKLQIGIMGSQSDLNYSKECEEFAKKLGKLIALSGNILVYGAEKDYSSLSTLAAQEASASGGITVGVTYNKDKNVYGNFKPTVIVPSGLCVGGGREFTLVLTCDVIISISGGSGTLNEICVAYQAGIPVVTVDKFDGWSKKLSNTYLDSRNRIKCVSASTAEETLNKAIKLCK